MKAADREFVDVQIDNAVTLAAIVILWGWKPAAWYGLVGVLVTIIGRATARKARGQGAYDVYGYGAGARDQEIGERRAGR